MQQLVELQNLRDKWINARPNYNNFVLDGILNNSIYSQQSPKILFLLKESNASFYDIAPLQQDNAGYGPKGNSNTFWRYMKGYEHIIQTVWNNMPFSEDEVLRIKETPNNSIAYVNIKKHCENKSVSSNNDLLKYAIADREFINEQVHLIEPQIIFCAGTFNLYRNINMNLQYVADKIYQAENIIVIDYLHLAHRRGYRTFQQLYEMLNVPALKEIISNSGKTVQI
jgi:hypothetical protein